MDDLMPHEREIQRRRLAQAAAPGVLPPPIPVPSASRRLPVQRVEVVPMWECAGCKVRVPRGESCPSCRKCLLEG